MPEYINVSIGDTIHTPTDACNAEGDNPTAKHPADARHTNDVIDKICDNSFDDNENIWSYRIHWYDLDNSHDTWEPLTNLARNVIVAYHHRQNIPLPRNIDQALDV